MGLAGNTPQDASILIAFRRVYPEVARSSRLSVAGGAVVDFLPVADSSLSR